MQRDFWEERWQKGETGFHQNVLNPYLGYFYGDKGPAHENRQELKVFVPLCGKSLDMFWLAQNGYAVLGIECSEIAVKSFFDEHNLEYQNIEGDLFNRYISEQVEGRCRIEILQGDFFDLTKADLEGITDIYDRASMIALPDSMRRRYAKKMVELQNPGMRTLLITLTYPQEEMNGPPFSVSEDEVHEFYSEHFNVDKLLGKNILSDEPRFQQRGLTSLYETAYKLTRT